MDIIKKTSQYIITRTWLNIPASRSLDGYDIYNIREDWDDDNTINSYLSCYSDRGWAYIAKKKVA